MFIFQQSSDFLIHTKLSVFILLHSLREMNHSYQFN